MCLRMTRWWYGVHQFILTHRFTILQQGTTQQEWLSLLASVSRWARSGAVDGVGVAVGATTTSTSITTTISIAIRTSAAIVIRILATEIGLRNCPIVAVTGPD